MNENMEAVQICGGSLVQIQPLITADSRFLICGNGTKISIFSCANGERCRVFKGHDTKVVSILEVSEDSNMIMSGSEDGKMYIWSYLNCTVESSFSLKMNLYHLQLSEEEMTNCFGVAKKADEEKFRIIKFTIPKHEEGEDEAKEEPTVESLAQVDGLGEMFAFGAQNSIFAWAANKQLKVLKCKTKEVFSHKAQTNITCMACHPREKLIATGTEEGKIVTWRDVCGARAITCEYHWHSLSLKTLHFSHDGASLYSGGYECVMVMWSLVDMTRSLLPRLGSPISRLSSSPDGSLVAVCSVHNGIRLVDSSFKIVQVIQGFARRCRDLPSASCTREVRYDRKTGLIFLAGRPGHLQFYDPFRDCHVFDLDVTKENYTSPQNLSNPLPCTEMTHVSLSEDGMWLASAQTLRYPGDVRIQTTLKFWRRSVGSFDFHSKYEMEDVTVTSLASGNFVKAGFAPTFATTTSDENLSTWKLVQVCDDSGKGGHAWKLGISSSYRNPRRCSFSCDGSVLGVVHDRCVTMWNMVEEKRERVMTVFGQNETHRMLVFGDKFESNVFYASSDKSLLCRSPNREEKWMIPLQVNIMMCKDNTEELVVFTADSKIEVFVPQSSSPIRSIHLSLTCPVVSACFKNDSLLFINDDQELYAVLSSDDQVTPDEATGEEKMEVDVLSRLTSGKGVETKKSSLKFIMDEKTKALMFSDDIWGTEFLEILTPRWKIPRKITVDIPDDI